MDKFSPENVHHKFCNSVQGIEKTSSNNTAKIELGRLPIDSFIRIQAMMYYSRIHSENINFLVKEAFNINKSMSEEGIYTWYTFVTSIFDEAKLEKN